MKVKICGLTNKDDAVWALNYNADFLGVNLYKESPRHNSIASASKWLSQLPSFANIVGIFVNAPEEEIILAVKKLKLKGIQLHGDESPEFISGLKEKLLEAGLSPFVIKAFRIENEESLSAMSAYVDVVDYFLLDAKVNGVQGGTGETFDWNLAVKAKEMGKPIFVAGGLNPENVSAVVKQVDPFAVDVASGVEKIRAEKRP